MPARAGSLLAQLTGRSPFRRTIAIAFAVGVALAGMGGRDRFRSHDRRLRRWRWWWRWSFGGRGGDRLRDWAVARLHRLGCWPRCRLLALARGPLDGLTDRARRRHDNCASLRRWGGRLRFQATDGWCRAGGRRPGWPRGGPGSVPGRRLLGDDLVVDGACRRARQRAVGGHGRAMVESQTDRSQAQRGGDTDQREGGAARPFQHAVAEQTQPGGPSRTLSTLVDHHDVHRP